MKGMTMENNIESEALMAAGGNDLLEIVELENRFVTGEDTVACACTCTCGCSSTSCILVGSSAE
jgi:hypothetical protein